MGRVGIYPGGLSSISLVGFWGAEEAGNNTANRYGVNAVLWGKIGWTNLWVQGDYGAEQANAALPVPTQDAKWWALGGWVTYDFSSSLGFPWPGAYFKEENAPRTKGALANPAPP